MNWRERSNTRIKNTIKLINKEESKDMELNEYQEKAMQTCLDTCKNITYMLSGLNAEVGEVNDKIAKAIRKGWIYIDGNHLVETEECPENFGMEVLKEVGDCLWFISGLSQVLSADLEFVAIMNLRKLSSRQQRGVIDGNGDNR